MARKTLRTNFRVEVVPEFFGSASEVRLESDCRDIANQIRRHVDGLAHGGVSVAWDNDQRCEHCNYPWTEKSETYNGGCCSKDEENDLEHLDGMLEDRSRES